MFAKWDVSVLKMLVFLLKIGIRRKEKQSST